MIEFVEVEIGKGSVAPCVLCTLAAERSFVSSDVVTRAITHLADSWKHGPGPNVRFVGVEPFTHPELPALVLAAVEAHCERICLRTDGGALSVPGNADGVIAAGVRHLQVVLLGGDAATHDRLTGRPGLFDAALEGMAAFSQAARKAHVRTVVTGFVPVCSHTMSSLPAAVAALAAAGAVAVELAVTSSAVSAVGLDGWLAAAIDTGMVNGTWVSVSGLPAEKIPRSVIHALAPARTAVHS